MKLVPKLTAALIVGTVLVLASNGYFRVRREVALLHADRVHNHALVGRALGAAVAAVWRSDGKRDALRVVEGANEHEGVVRIRSKCTQGSRPFPPAPTIVSRASPVRFALKWTPEPFPP